MKDDIIGVVSAFRPSLFQGKSSEWDQEVTITSQRKEPAGDKIYWVQFQCDALGAARTVWGTGHMSSDRFYQLSTGLTLDSNQSSSAVNRSYIVLEGSSSSASFIQVSTTFWLVSY